MKMGRCVLAYAGVAWATVTSVVAMSDVEVKAVAGYVGGIAGTHFCACEDWPDSFDALKEFDDRLHDLSRRQGQKSVKRIPWKQLWNSDLDKREKGGLDHRQVKDAIRFVRESLRRCPVDSYFGESRGMRSRRVCDHGYNSHGQGDCLAKPEYPFPRDANAIRLGEFSGTSIADIFVFSEITREEISPAFKSANTTP